MRYFGGIYLSLGPYSKVMIGCAFFNESILESVVYDKPTMEKLLQFFPSSVEFETLTDIKPNKILTREYFDGYLHAYRNGIIQLKKSSIHSDVGNDDELKKFANAIFGKHSKCEYLIMYKKED